MIMMEVVCHITFIDFFSKRFFIVQYGVMEVSFHVKNMSVLHIQEVIL